MDSELFTVGGANALPMANADWKDKNASVENYYWQACRTMQVGRHSLKLLWWCMLFLIIYLVVLMIPLVLSAYADMASKLSFTQKEGLLYQGASTNVTRDDMGWPTHDTLAEQAAKAQARITDMGVAGAAPPAPYTPYDPLPAKVNFVVPRETMALNPEEELIKKQKASSRM